MSETNEFEFIVRDSTGLWGSVRIATDDAERAERVIRERLIREEVEPNGSLLPDFTLTPSSKGA